MSWDRRRELRAAITSLRRGSSAEDVRRLQDDVRATLDPVVERAAAAGVTIGVRFETAPFFTAVVDGTGLAWLGAQPEVAFVRAPDNLFYRVADISGTAITEATGSRALDRSVRGKVPSTRP